MTAAASVVRRQIRVADRWGPGISLATYDGNLSCRSTSRGCQVWLWLSLEHQRRIIGPCSARLGDRRRGLREGHRVVGPVHAPAAWKPALR